jgi:Cysteine rich repeat
MTTTQISIAALVLLAGAGMACGQQGMTLTPEARAKVMQAGRICRPDIDRFCTGVKPGGGRVLQCLQGHQAELSSECSAVLKSVNPR